MNDHSLILFDGVCNLCNAAVQFVIKRDKRKSFSFASLQSVEGQRLMQRFQLPASDFNSFVLIDDAKAFTKSTAALMVAKKLGGAWPLLAGFRIVPEFMRDGVYNWVAKNRYKWFGRKDACMIPTPELKARFLN